MIVTQALVPRLGGGRIGLREYLVFDENIREQLLDMPVDRWTTETQRFLVRYGRTMEQSANEAFKNGLIDRRTYLLLIKGFSGDEATAGEDTTFDQEAMAAAESAGPSDFLTFEGHDEGEAEGHDPDPDLTIL